MVNLFGPRALVVNPERLERQLMAEFPKPDRTAIYIATYAAALDATLVANPAIEALVHDQTCLGIAGLYGHMLGGLRVMADRNEGEVRELALSTLARVEQIVRLAQTELPEEAGDANQNQGPSDMLGSLEEAISEL